MIAAAENEGRSRGLLRDGVCSVAAYVVECPRDIVFAQDDQNRKVSNLERSVIARSGEAATVGDAEPRLCV